MPDSAEPHALVYSFVAIQTLFLATNFPVIYWNCACLIVDSGSIEDDDEAITEENDDDIDDDNDDDDEFEAVENKKEKKRKIDYGKLASAIGKFKTLGLNIFPPDINTSGMGPTPDEHKNAIYYGLRGIKKVPMSVVDKTLAYRPFTSLNDFISKTGSTKVPVINLIKAGAFDEIEGEDRKSILYDYLLSSLKTIKKTLNLRNMDQLIKMNLFPEDLSFYVKLYSFNKTLKSHKEETYYHLYSTKMLAFFSEFFDTDMLTNSEYIDIKKWDKIYDKQMDFVRQYIKDHLPELLKEVNGKIIEDEIKKYASGSISKWEMDSLNFYYHEHELAKINAPAYNIVNFFDLPEDPIIDSMFYSKDGREVYLYKLFRIAGTVLDKNKIKGSITLLTADGVVTVKIWKNQYALYDRQIKGLDEASGKNKILEKSWFTRGEKLLLTGIRRGDAFIPKRYKNSSYQHVIEKITDVKDNGFIVTDSERIVV